MNPQTDMLQRRAKREEFVTMTHSVCSVVGFLLGVPKEHFSNPADEAMDLEVYDRLFLDQDALTFRYLCMLRTAFQQNYGKIVQQFTTYYKNISTIPDLVPSEALEGLQRVGITFFHSKPQIDDYIVEVNEQILRRIDTIKRLFPEWLKWDYVRPLFLMPNGLKKDKLKAVGEFYNSDRNRYPYQCWLNWDAVSTGRDNKGNILYCDEKLVNLLYERNEDYFENKSFVRDIGNAARRSMEEFFQRAKKCVVLVDCENSDAIKLAGAISSFTAEQKASITTVILFDSEYTKPTWKTMVDMLIRESVSEQGDVSNSLRIEHKMIERLIGTKSQVDMALTAGASKEVYANGADSIILVSSDSDYWAMMNALGSVRFMVMMEREKTSQTILDAMTQREIPFCFLDDYSIAASYSIKTTTLVKLIQEEIDLVLTGQNQRILNLRKLLDEVLSGSWIEMTDREKESFYQRFLSRPSIKIEKDGQLTICLQPK